MLTRCLNSLFVALLLFSVNSQASTWLLRTSNNASVNQSISSAPVFSFSNGDFLYSLEPEQLAEINLQQLFVAPGFRYLEANQDIEQHHPLTRSRLMSQPSQDFLQQDSFNQLPVWQRNCADITIAVIDSGVDMTHPQLQNVTFTAPLDARLADNPLTDEYGHGTHVAGLLAAQQDSDNTVQGACTSATLMPIRFLDRYGAGGVADAIKGISWAIEHHAQIINHSWTVRDYSQSLFDVIKEANDLGIVQVAAAGNLGSDNDQSAVYPAAFSSKLNGFISVANWDNDQQQLFNTSNYGLTGVDLAASGTNVISLAPNNSTKMRTGTSMAAPLVSATAAMLKQQDPSLTAAQIRTILQLSTKPEVKLTTKVRSAGRLDALAALREDKNQSNLLFVSTDAHFITLNGIGFSSDDHWQFTTATLPAKTYPLEVVSSSKQQVMLMNEELGYGYWQLFRNGELINQLAYQPALAVPTQLQASRTASGQLISWRGSLAAEKYQLQAAIDDQGFITIAELTAPSNQFEHIVADYKTIRYRIKASYDYQFSGEDIHTKHSLYSDTLNIAGENMLWQSDIIGSAPQGADAIIPLQVASEDTGGFFEVLDDPDGLISRLDSTGNLYLNTEQAISSMVTVGYHHNTEQSIKQLALSVHDNSSWLLPTNTDEKIALTSNGFVIHSLQRLIDGDYQIDGMISDPHALLSFTLDSSGRKFDAVNVYDSGKLLTESQIDMKEQQLNINLSADASKRAGSRRIVIELSLRDKTNSTDSRCFIASSIYPQQPNKLQKLRTFRDQVLLKMPGGQTIVETYYHYSPILVEKMKAFPRMKSLLTSILDLFL